MLRCLVFLTITAVLSSCARPPHQELDAAEYMVGRAYAMQAMEFAPTEYLAAKTALADARKSLQKTDYGDARASLEFSLKHARRAVVLTEERKAKRAEEEADRALKEEKARQVAVSEKIQVKEVASQPPPPPAPPKPAPKPKTTPVSSYSVSEGETLWTISANPKVYNEGLLWPLLYQANRDQIKDPRQIFPGQILSIRRDMTEKDLEDARQRARESDIFPIPNTVSPTQ